MLISPTENIGKLLASFAGISPGGPLQFSTSIQIAQLALKHRKNKNGGQRIIVFVGSPIAEDIKTLEKIGKLLKKNNIAVDVVVMGEHAEIQEKLTEFVKAASSNDNRYHILLFASEVTTHTLRACSHLVVVPPGMLPSDALISSPIFQQDRGDDGGLAAAMAASVAGSGGGGGGDAFADYGGIDPSMDPELAMAIRISAEEARSREQKVSHLSLCI
jgi:26S proteasome regulatory subunit N10